MTTKNTSKMFLYPGRGKQHGATLITALVMLVVLTLLAVSGIRSSSTNLRIAGNMQEQAEAVAAAQQVIERVLSDGNFTASLAAAAAAVTANNITVRITNKDYPATVSINCVATQPLSAPLDASNDNDKLCFSTSTATPGPYYAGAPAAPPNRHERLPRAALGNHGSRRECKSSRAAGRISAC